MIDLHCHILPGVDDGAPSLDDSRQMLLRARALGYKTIVATPHLEDALGEAHDARVRAAFAEVLPIARELGMWLLPGFEIRLTPYVAERLAQGERSTLANSRTVLVDLASAQLPRFVDDALFALQTAGYQPILAHPERYPDIQDDPEYALHLAQRGIALQLTIGSLSGAFGGHARKSAEALLRIGAIHLVATDAHSAGHRMKAVPDGLRQLWNLLGAEQYRQVMVDAPHALLTGEPLPAPVVALDRGLRGKIPLLRR